MFELLTWFRSRVSQCHCCLQDADGPVCSLCLAQIEKFCDLYVPTRCRFLNQQPNFIRHLPKLSHFNTVSIGPHIGLLQHLINDFKYRRKSLLVSPLAEILQNQIAMAYSEQSLPELLVPVPMHPFKRFTRGFNQTELLSNRLARGLAIPENHNIVSRTKYRGSQAGQSGPQRRKLNANTFKVKQQGALKALNHMALVDDVITTGSTLTAIIKPLLQVNPDIRIDLWSLSVSLPHQ